MQRQHGKARTQVNGPLQARFLEARQADERFSLPLEHFQRLIASGEMKEVTPSTPSPLQESVREIVLRASPKALEAANRRLRAILACSFRGN